jgi:hypothetical protein
MEYNVAGKAAGTVTKREGVEKSNLVRRLAETTDSVRHPANDRLSAYPWASTRRFLLFPMPSPDLMQVSGSIRLLEGRIARLLVHRLDGRARVLVFLLSTEHLAGKIEMLETGESLIDGTRTEAGFITALVPSHFAIAVAQSLVKHTDPS